MEGFACGSLELGDLATHAGSDNTGAAEALGRWQENRKEKAFDVPRLAVVAGILISLRVLGHVVAALLEEMKDAKGSCLLR